MSGLNGTRMSTRLEQSPVELTPLYLLARTLESECRAAKFEGVDLMLSIGIGDRFQLP